MAVALSASVAVADQVSQLTVLRRPGQSFITWTCPPGTGWVYRIYASATPIQRTSDLYHAVIAGMVEDSTWYDRRLSPLLGTPCAYRIDSLAAPLDPSQGLFVRTNVTTGYGCYAVTAQAGPSADEDMTIVPGANSLTRPVPEHVALPQPVFQRVLTSRSTQPLIYTLWTSDVGTLAFPAMANIPSLPFDCAAIPAPQSNGSLLINMHPRSGNFLQGVYGTGMPNEAVLSLDDPINNSDMNSFWYGYHESYDTQADDNGPPSEGVVHDYTLRRVIWTLQWMEQKFPVDNTRVYAWGNSMGGIGSVLLAMRRPDLIAGIMTIAAKFDFSFLNDPNPLNGFNLGGGLRQCTDRLWGEVSTDLPASDGGSIYQRLNDGWVAGTMRPVAVPPIIAFNGRNDVTVGWAEKIAFYHDMAGARQGGYFFWDTRDHLNNANATWSPAQDVRYIYRFRTNRSFPALSSCSVDNDPGDGSLASGDSVGCINGWVEWDTTLVDRPDRWETRLWTRDLPQLQGWVTGPDSVTVDVTPRRLQQFVVVDGATYHYTVIRQLDGAVIQSGSLTTDDSHLLTVPQARVYRSGTVVRLEPEGALAVDAGAPGVGIRIALARNPIDALTAVELRWPAAGPARVDLIDVSGRVVRTLLDAKVAAGPVRLTLSSRALESGVYFLVASQRGLRAVQRTVVIH
jgi:pimeloyl-ACP methyl ester carboxylesterase